MDNFDLKKYLAEGTIHQEITEKKYKQGYDDREDESLGARKGAEKDKKQSMKDRRDDSYGKFGKRDAEKKGKNKINKEGVELNEFDADVVAVGAPLVMSVVAAGVAKMGYDAVMDMIKKKFPKEDAEYSAQEDIEISMSEEEVSEYGKKPMYDEDDKDAMKEDARTDAEQEGYKDGFEDAKDDIEAELKKMKVSELKAKIRERILAELSGEELEEGWQEEVGSQYHDSLYTEAEEDVDVDIEDKEEVDVDVDVEDEVSVAAGGDDIEIERPSVKAKVQVGLSPEEEIVQDSLKAAMDAANALGNDKLADQIGNTITFFTREYVVGNNTD